MRKRRPRRGSDEAWKYAIRAFFRECLQLLFTAVHDQVDWARPVEFLDANLYRLAPAVRGKRRQTADVVVKVHFRDGTERIVIIHIEIQRNPTPISPCGCLSITTMSLDAYEYPEVVEAWQSWLMPTRIGVRIPLGTRMSVVDAGLSFPQ